MRALLSLAFAAVALLPGCDRAGPQPTAPQTMAAGGGPHFLSLIAEAPFHTAYFARRHVWQTYTQASGPATLEYNEAVWSDGQGHFSVDPEHVLQPALPAQAEQMFLLMQKAREGFLYRLRDFRIQELNTFLQSYTVEDLSQHVSVAGEGCERLRIRPLAPGPIYWEIDVAPATGLILATREFQINGSASVLVSLVETTEYQANPDLTGVNLHQDLPSTSFTPATAQQVLGFTPLQPTFLPQGFTLTRAEMIAQGGENWARYAYTNGGDTLFVLYRREPPGSVPTMDAGGPYTIKSFSAGRWSVAQASLGKHHIVVLGREPATVLQQVLESCAP